MPGKASQLFCSDAHRVAWTNRWTARGRVWITLGITARLTRNGTRGGHPFARRASIDADTLMQRWMQEDARAGRMDVRDATDARYRAGFDPL